ncbi:MAG TPA: ATP-dependent DNA helicase RecG [Solirubrobacteraceae bacterium]|nr:ATP-dependent DNA helicase RecG [Solirubrobacteraceae bacterium]
MAPWAFASRRPLSRAELLGAPIRWPRPSELERELSVPGVKAAEALRTLGLETVGDLFEHLPRDHREARTVATLCPGEQATVAVEVRRIASRAVRRRGMRPMVEAVVFDLTGSTRATFFNQPWLLERYPPGTQLLLHGKVSTAGRFNVVHHAIGKGLGDEKGVGGAGGLGDDEDAEAERGRTVAHYPASEGLTSTQILTLVQESRGALADVPEPLGGALRAAEGLPDRASALAALHFPTVPGDHEAGRRRLAFEELLLGQLLFLRRRARRGRERRASALDEPPSLSARWLEHGLPFTLTGEQSAAIETIRRDLESTRPMQRLLMGEVGSGKTVVALYAMLRAVEHGRQAVLMAPTETLAEQHFATLQRLLGAETVPCALLMGSTPSRRRREILGKIESGELSLVVGTHALIEPTVSFRSLALAVVDEQHRFGVCQRAALEGDGSTHVLHMTATPIPRTLALSRYGDLDVTALRELPRGRRPISTRIVAGEQARAEAYAQVRAQLEEGRQAYVVCPLVDLGEVEPGPGGAEKEMAADRPGGVGAPGGAVDAGELRAATEELRRLSEGELAGRRLALLHGQMRAREKQEAMAAFASGDIDVLVATTVIEVGVDVANASVMLVENAERFGISQLHQLRGRVGRGEHPSLCLLVGPPDSPRLRALAEHSDGFRLAEIDLRLRREGELVGTRQSGLGQFRIASLPQDAELLQRARARARAILREDPELCAPEHALLAEAFERAFGEEALEPIPA